MNTVCRIAALACVLASWSAAAGPLRDPFARPVMAAPVPASSAAEDAAPAPAPAPPPVLRAVMYEPGHSMANLSGRIVSTGDWYGQYKIIRIDERSVTLLREKVKSVLVLDMESGK